jgi:hypothetical protein
MSQANFLFSAEAVPVIFADEIACAKKPIWVQALLHAMAVLPVLAGLGCAAVFRRPGDAGKKEKSWPEPFSS